MIVGYCGLIVLIYYILLWVCAWFFVFAWLFASYFGCYFVCLGVVLILWLLMCLVVACGLVWLFTYMVVFGWSLALASIPGCCCFCCVDFLGWLLLCAFGSLGLWMLVLLGCGYAVSLGCAYWIAVGLFTVVRVCYLFFGVRLLSGWLLCLQLLAAVCCVAVDFWVNAGTCWCGVAVLWWVDCCLDLFIITL